MINFRLMTPDDIPAGLTLCRHAGWNQLAGDWELFLRTNPLGCKVAIDDSDQVIGTVTTIRYQKHFSWIGMVLVDTKFRRQGIGTKLLNEALKILKDEETIKLDATPVGREVYLPLGFVDEYPLSRMQLTSVDHNKLPPSTASPMNDDNFSQLQSLDEKIFGADRSALLRWMLRTAPHLAFITRDNDVINGYCFGRRGYHFTHIGPVIAENVSSAINLASAAIINASGPVILDIPHHTPEWNNWISSIGFTEQRPFIRMFKGTNRYAGIPKKQFAILGPELG